MVNLTQESMSVMDWIGVADCPIQRNTELHANKARRVHLKKSSVTHMRVSAARIPSGKIFKLDGHTRAFLWNDGSLVPDGNTVYVDMYNVQSINEVEELYKQFDSQCAAENAVDRLFGAYRLHGFEPESALLKKGAVTSAIYLIYKNDAKKGIYNLIIPFIPALRIIDKSQFHFRQFPSGIFAAMIITVYRYGHPAMEFWERYHNDDGQKNGKKRDAVQALTEIVSNLKIGKKIVSRRSLVIDLFGKALSTFHAYQEGRVYTCGVKTMDVSKYISETLKIECLGQQKTHA